MDNNTKKQLDTLIKYCLIYECLVQDTFKYSIMAFGQDNKKVIPYCLAVINSKGKLILADHDITQERAEYLYQQLKTKYREFIN